MNCKPGVAPHELLALHEFLAAEVAAAQKMQANLAAVKDAELKAFMKDAIAARQRRAGRIEQLMSGARTLQ